MKLQLIGLILLFVVRVNAHVDISIKLLNFVKNMYLYLLVIHNVLTELLNFLKKICIYMVNMKRSLLMIQNVFFIRQLISFLLLGNNGKLYIIYVILNHELEL